MNMDNLSFCFHFFKINMDNSVYHQKCHSSPEAVLTHSNNMDNTSNCLSTLQDQMDTFFYFHRDCNQVHQAVLTHFHEEGQYLSLFFHFIKIKMDMWTLSCCTLSVRVHMSGLDTFYFKHSTMSALSSISSNLQRFDTLLDQHVPCNLNVNITFKSWTWTEDITKSVAVVLTHLCDYQCLE